MNRNKNFPCLVCGAIVGTSGVSNNYDSHCWGMTTTGPGALLCRTTGNYGSTIFDPEGSEFIDFVVCDDCMIEHKDRIRMVTGNTRRAKQYGKVVKEPFKEVLEYREEQKKQQP